MCDETDATTTETIICSSSSSSSSLTRKVSNRIGRRENQRRNPCAFETREDEHSAHTLLLTTHHARQTKPMVLQLHQNVFIYIYIYICVCVCVYVYIYISLPPRRTTKKFWRKKSSPTKKGAKKKKVANDTLNINPKLFLFCSSLDPLFFSLKKTIR